MTSVLRPLMFVGTASDVGKSVITAGFCRILQQDGYRPAPFKAQNMSLNSYVTPEGLEIGRAQAVQAEAAGIPCHSDMNPVLLKPTGDRNAQLVLNGRPAGNQSAYDYFMGKDRAELWEEVKKAYDRLSAQYNPVVLEGAGSISEINLRKRDITNMRMALYAKADVYLIADIDRGGVFASVYGTLALLPPEEKALIRGVLINKFRGDGRLFEDGRRQLEELTGTPIVGVLPFYKDIHIEEEDSVALGQKASTSRPGAFNIAVIRLPHLSNFTDFLWLEKTEGLHVYYTDDPAQLAGAQLIVLPGSKNTIDDLLYIRSRGMDGVICEAVPAGRSVVGICGGYQMMGRTIADPYGVEGEVRTVEGLGLLPVHTTLEKEKTTVRRRFHFGSPDGPLCEGYEIHMGTTVVEDGASLPVGGPAGRALNYPAEAAGRPDGYYHSGTCWGTYMHGILDNRSVVEDLLLRAGAGGLVIQWSDYAFFKQQQYDRLAEHIRQNVDLQAIYRSLQQPGMI
ncbi:MAG TPA: cobyric acid synthase [Puia sp.]|nr:cobyric acid synthase [Puia sp.]